jgi:hypothetical protein
MFTIADKAVMARGARLCAKRGRHKRASSRAAAAREPRGSYNTSHTITPPAAYS